MQLWGLWFGVVCLFLIRTRQFILMICNIPQGKPINKAFNEGRSFRKRLISHRERYGRLDPEYKVGLRWLYVCFSVIVVSSLG